MERLTKLHNDAEEEQKRLAQLQDQCVRNLLTLQGKVEEINLLLNETEEEPVVEDYEDETIVEYPEENFPTSFGEGEDIPGMNEVVE